MGCHSSNNRIEQHITQRFCKDTHRNYATCPLNDFRNASIAVREVLVPDSQVDFVLDFDRVPIDVAAPVTWRNPTNYDATRLWINRRCWLVDNSRPSARFNP